MLGSPSPLGSSGGIDPIPTSVHIFSIALVPLATAIELSSRRSVWGRSDSGRSLRMRAALVGAALGVCVYFAIPFLRLIPIGLMLCVIGLGFLVLSPLLAMIAMVALLRGVLAAATARCARVGSVALCAGVFAVACLLGAEIRQHARIELLARACSTNAGVREAAADAIRERGIDVLELPSNWTDGSISCTPYASLIEKTQGEGLGKIDRTRLEFVVLGRERSSPWSERRSDRWFSPLPSDVTGGWFGNSSTMFRTRSIAIDGTLDSAAAVLEVDYRLEVARSNWMDEAILGIRVPPGAIATDLFLEIDGTERSAAFASTERATKAYESVVVRKRDPALLRAFSARDLVLNISPFAAGEARRVRIHFVVPLDATASSARVDLPRVIGTGHGGGLVDLEGDVAVHLTTDSRFLSSEVASEPVHEFTATIPATKFESEGVGELRIARDDVRLVKAKSAFGAGSVYERFDEVRGEGEGKPRRVVLVVDRSAGLAPIEARLRAACESLARDPAIDLSFTHSPTSRMLFEPTFWAPLAAGGVDPLGELLGAMRRLDRDASRVVFVSGPQPVILDPPEWIDSTYPTLGSRASLAVVEVVAGRNVVAERCEAMGRCDRFMGHGYGVELEDVLAKAVKVDPEGRVRRFDEFLPSDSPAAIVETTSRGPGLLAAYEEIARQCAGSDAVAKAKAIERATTLRIVTLWTAAVVLEAKEQFEASGIAAPSDAPSVPNSTLGFGSTRRFGGGPDLDTLATFLSLLVGTAFGIFVIMQRRRRARVEIA